MYFGGKAGIIVTGKEVKISFIKFNEILHRLTVRGFSPKRELHTGSIHPRSKDHGFLESFNKLCLPPI